MGELGRDWFGEEVRCECSGCGVRQMCMGRRRGVGVGEGWWSGR